MLKRIFGGVWIGMFLLAATACAPQGAATADVTAAQVAVPADTAAAATVHALPDEDPTQEPSALAELPTQTPAAAGGQAQLIAPENAAQLSMTGSMDVAVANKLDWSSDGRLLGVENQDGLMLLTADNLAVDARVLAADPMSILDLSADTLLMASTSDMATVSLRNMETGAVEQEVDTGQPIYTAVFSPDGQRLYVASIDEIAADAYDVNTGELLQHYSGFDTAAPVYSIMISSNGQQLIWISRGKVQLMDIHTGEPGPEFGHEDWANSVQLSPDGSLLAVATAATVNGEYQPIVQLWNAASGEAAGQLLTGSVGAIASAVAFSPDGRLLAVGADHDIQLWDVAAQSLLTTIAAHEDRVNSLAFSPQGTALASSSSDNTLKLWQVPQP